MQITIPLTNMSFTAGDEWYTYLRRLLPGWGTIPFFPVQIYFRLLHTLWKLLKLIFNEVFFPHRHVLLSVVWRKKNCSMSGFELKESYSSKKKCWAGGSISILSPQGQ